MTSASDDEHRVRVLIMALHRDCTRNQDWLDRHPGWDIGRMTVKTDPGDAFAAYGKLRFNDKRVEVVTDLSLFI